MGTIPILLHKKVPLAILWRHGKMGYVWPDNLFWTWIFWPRVKKSWLDLWSDLFFWVNLNRYCFKKKKLIINLVFLNKCITQTQLIIIIIKPLSTLLPAQPLHFYLYLFLDLPNHIIMKQYLCSLFIFINPSPVFFL